MTKNFFTLVVFVIFFISIQKAYSQCGIITTVVGNGTNYFSGNGGPATAAEIFMPEKVAFDRLGNLFFVDEINDVIRKVNSSGIISTIAGIPDSATGGSDTGPATATTIIPHYIAIDSIGNIYMTDAYKIRKIDTAGMISTICGTGFPGYSGDGGNATNAEINHVYGIALAFNGDIIFSDRYNHRIRKIDNAGIITTIVGIGIAGYSGDNGVATAAYLKYQEGLTIDKFGLIYFADGDNHCIRKIDSNNIITTIAGNGTSGYSGDGGAATTAKLHLPYDVAFDKFHNLYIADYYNDCIRKVDNDGIISTFAGTGIAGYDGDGGMATALKLNCPHGVTFDSSGNLFISDWANNRIRKINVCYSPLTPILGPNSVCIGSTISLTNSISGGDWSASNTNATISAGVVTGVIEGVDTITDLPVKIEVQIG